MRTIAALSFLACPAYASCPTGADVAGGIRLTRAVPYFDVTMTAEGPVGAREMRVMERDGVRERIETWYPHPLVAGERHGPRGSLETVYAASPLGLARLDETGRWESAVEVFADGDLLAEGRVTAILQGTDDVIVGDCCYDAWVVEVTTALEGFESTAFLHAFVPELRASLEVLRRSQEGVPQSVVSFDRIEAVR